MAVMPPLVLYADRALTPLEEIPNVACVVEDGTITAIGTRDRVACPANGRELDARGLTLVPGFLDIHIHGAGGRDVMDTDSDALNTVATTVARYGTTSILATTVTAEPDLTCRAVERIAKHIEEQRSASPSSPRAQYLGIHLEGPFISAARRGVHDAQWIAPPDIGLLKRLTQAARGHARILTQAPELPGALELVAAASAENLLVSMGHTDATYDEARRAIGGGARHATHVFNAMRPFSHRETGVLGAVLTDATVATELIADTVHVDPAAMRLLIAAKGVAGVIVVSDATAATGMPDGKYRLGTMEVAVAGGVCRSTEGRLAGSTLTLDRGLRNILSLGIPLPAALQMLTLNPARSLGVEKRKGTLAVGADADMVLMNKQHEVVQVFTRGVPS